MTRLVSFGPVFVAAAFPKSPRLSETSIVPIYVIVSMLNHEMKKRGLTTGPNDARRVVWAHFRSHLTPASLVTWRPCPRLQVWCWCHMLVLVLVTWCRVLVLVVAWLCGVGVHVVTWWTVLVGPGIPLLVEKIY
jgi:hypothetical protein